MNIIKPEPVSHRVQSAEQSEITFGVSVFRGEKDDRGGVETGADRCRRDIFQISQLFCRQTDPFPRLLPDFLCPRMIPQRP